MAVNFMSSPYHLLRWKAMARWPASPPGAYLDTAPGARLCEPQHADCKGDAKADSNVGFAGDALRVTDPRSVSTSRFFGGSFEMRHRACGLVRNHLTTAPVIARFKT